MNHYIIVKFLEDYDYISKIEEIKELFNESLALAGVEKIEIFKSNSKLYLSFIFLIRTKSATNIIIPKETRLDTIDLLLTI